MLHVGVEISYILKRYNNKMEPDEITSGSTLHVYLLKYNKSAGTEMHIALKFISCDPSKYVR